MSELENEALSPEFLVFLANIGEELVDLFKHIKAGQSDPEKEKDLAMRVVRKAIDEQAKAEINGNA